VFTSIVLVNGWYFFCFWRCSTGKKKICELIIKIYTFGSSHRREITSLAMGVLAWTSVGFSYPICHFFDKIYTYFLNFSCATGWVYLLLRFNMSYIYFFLIIQRKKKRGGKIWGILGYFVTIFKFFEFWIFERFTNHNFLVLVFI